MMRRLWILVGLLCLVAGSAWASLDWLERRAIYPFSPLRLTPAEAGLPQANEHVFAVAGAEVIVWTIPPQPGQPTILYLHGNAGNLASRAGRFRLFAQSGFGLVAPSYRGASGSTGRPSEPALIADTLAVWQAAPDWVGTHPQVIYGESLGTGVALALDEQLRRRPGSVLPQGIVLEAPYLSMPEVAKSHFPLPGPILRQIRSRWNSAERAPGVVTPVLVLHGMADDVVPYLHGRTLFALLGSADKEMVSIDGGTHTTVWVDRAARAALWAFIARFTP